MSMTIFTKSDVTSLRLTECDLTKLRRDSDHVTLLHVFSKKQQQQQQQQRRRRRRVYCRTLRISLSINTTEYDIFSLLFSLVCELLPLLNYARKYTRLKKIVHFVFG